MPEIKNIPTLKIHRLSQEQYDRELADDNLDPDALYLTPEPPANPPLLPGVEYRTTERFLGKPVYVRMIEEFEIPGAGDSADVSLPDEITGLVRVEGYSKHSGAGDITIVPLQYCCESIDVLMNAEMGTVLTVIGAFHVGATVHMAIYYTKV